MFDQAENATVSAEELSEFVAVAASFAKDVPGKDWAELDAAEAAAVARSWQGICDIGFERCIVPEGDGGAGLPAAALPPLLEEIAAGDGGVALLMLLSNIAADALAGQPQEGLSATARLAYVPPVGSQPVDQRLPQLADGKLNGRASFVLGAHGADGFVVACSEQAERALAWLPAGADGLAAEELDDQLGLRSARAAALDFKDTPAVRLAGAEAFERAEALLAAGLSAVARGTCRRARGLAQEYAENRWQGGTEIINHGAVRDMLARMSERELGMPQPQFSSDQQLARALAGKIAISDAAVATTIDAIQVFGGMGYMRETGAEKLMRDARYCQLYPRPNWAQRDELLELQR